MGPSEVQALIGQWVNIVGEEHDHDRDRDRDHDRDPEGRGEYGRDRDRWQQQPWQQQPWQQQPWQQQPWQQQPWQQYPRPASSYRQPYQMPAPGTLGAPYGYGGRRPPPGSRGAMYDSQIRAAEARARAHAPLYPGGPVRDQGGIDLPFGLGRISGLPWYSVIGAEPGNGSIYPRNALIEAPGPEHAGREVLPMSTGVAILPTQSAQITARPQRVAFRPERVFISAAGTSGGAADWVVNDIKIGNRSQFSQSGDVPGDMFATNAIDGFVSFETAQTAMDVVMVVTYIGLNESGVPFFASIVGTAAI
jgi:hypothetical protein